MRLRLTLLFVTSTLSFAGFGCGSASDSPAQTPPTPPTSSDPRPTVATPASLVLFGGYFTDHPPSESDPPSDYLGGTYSFDGSSWTRQTVAGPGSRNMASVGTVQGQPILFGGEGGDPDHNRTTLGDTWTWSGKEWTESHVPGGPEAMAGATGVTCNDRFVLFGGYDLTGTNRYDTWSFDGTRWTEFPSTGEGFQPPKTGPQNSLETVAAAVGSRCYLIDLDAKMYSWSGAAWETVDQGSVVPPARTAASAASLASTLVLFGGVTAAGQVLDDTWSWDGKSWTKANAAGPVARSSAMMASFGDKVVLFGGEQALDASGATAPKFLGDTWTWDGTRWSEIKGTGPSPRATAAMIGI
jgi:hypothetical protein